MRLLVGRIHRIGAERQLVCNGKCSENRIICVNHPRGRASSTKRVIGLHIAKSSMITGRGMIGGSGSSDGVRRERKLTDVKGRNRVEERTSASDVAEEGRERERETEEIREHASAWKGNAAQRRTRPPKVANGAQRRDAEQNWVALESWWRQAGRPVARPPQSHRHQLCRRSLPKNSFLRSETVYFAVLSLLFLLLLFA